MIKKVPYLITLFLGIQVIPVQATETVGLTSFLKQWSPSYKTALTLAATAAGLTTLYRYYQYKQTVTDWHNLEQEKNSFFPPRASHFPPDFLWGAGTSSYQVDGNCPHSTYEQWAKEQHTKGEKYESAGIACDHWHKYTEDIEIMKKLGIKAYRFSIEWSRIEPRQGEYNSDAIAHYIDVCAQLHKQGIKPIIGFHHYSDPQWFMDKGGFAQEKNIQLFVAFCKTFFTALASHLPLLFADPKNPPFFLTFNSPASYAVNGYLTGKRPPGQQNMQAMLTVLSNMLNAHVAVYQALKAHAYGKNIRVGITHNIYQLDPAHWFNPIHQIKCYFGNKITHDCVYQFFTKGVFSVSIPTKASVHCVNNAAQNSLDFIGLNYYCHGQMSNGPAAAADEEPTDNPLYTIYAKGMYRAIKEVAHNLALPLRIPIYITENGIGTDDDAKRVRFLDRYLYAVAQAVRDELPVKGYCYWSLLDNFEWGRYDIKYGLCGVDRESMQRTIKPSAHYFAQLISGAARA